MSVTKPDLKAAAAAASRKEAMLVGLLGALSEELAVKLAQALEMDRLAGGTGLPFDQIMAGLRPRLRQAQARKRIPTPQRAFFQVVDGLIADDRSEEKRPGRIARRHLDAIWTWLIGAGGGELKSLRDDIAKAILKSDRAEMRAAFFKFDRIAGETIRGAIKKAEGNNRALKELTAAVGGQRALEDLRELGRVVMIGTELRKLADDLPAVFDPNVPEQFDVLRIAYNTVMDKASATAPYVVLALVPRVVHPWDLFGIAAKLVDANDDQDLKQSDLAMVGEWLVSDLEAEAAQLKGLKPVGFDAQHADEGLRRFAVLQAGMTRAVGMRKDGQWGKRLLKARGAVSEALEALFTQIGLDLRAGLPMQKATSGPKSGGLVPQLESPPDAAQMKRLEALIQFLATAKLFSNQLGYSVAFEKARADTTSFLEEFAQGVMDILVSKQRKERDTALPWIEPTLKIMSGVLTDEALKIMTRRFTAASGDQVAAR